MPEKTMKNSKSLILLRLFCLACILLLVTTVVFFPVSADNSSGYDFYDYDDFATYRNDGESINVTLDLPFRSCYQLLDGTTKSFSNSSFTVTLNELFDLRINPFFYHGTPPTVGYKYSYGDFLDLTKMPKNFTLSTSYTFTVLGSSFEDIVSAITYVAFVDDVGKVVYRSSLDTTITTTFTPDSCLVQFEDSFDSSTANIPSSAKGMFLFIVVDCINLYDNVQLTFNMQPLSLSFNISDAFFNFKNESIVRDELSNIDKQLGDLNVKFDGIQDSINDQNDKLDELPGQIGDEMQGIIDHEKQEAQGEGNKFVDQILDALPDPSQDVLAALRGLTDATAYSGTDAVLPIPAIVLPGIDGLFPETEIWGGTEFDFGEYIGMLPAALLTLVQSLFTIAIVLFCVYELKGIISYCLTLRESKGG